MRRRHRASRPGAAHAAVGLPGHLGHRVEGVEAAPLRASVRVTGQPDPLGTQMPSRSIRPLRRAGHRVRRPIAATITAPLCEVNGVGRGRSAHRAAAPAHRSRPRAGPPLPLTDPARAPGRRSRRWIGPPSSHDEARFGRCS
jgi:hypothetical protein